MSCRSTSKVWVGSVGQTSASGGPLGVVLQVSRGAGGRVGVAFGDIGLGLGDDAAVGEEEVCDVGKGEGCKVGEGVSVPVVVGPQAVASAVIPTSHTTDLRLTLEHSLRGKRLEDVKSF